MSGPINRPESTNALGRMDATRLDCTDRNRRARLALSLIIEPGDERLVDFFGRYSESELLDGIQGTNSLQVPSSWRQRAKSMPDISQVQAQAVASGLRWVTHGDPEWPPQLDGLNYSPSIAGVGGEPLGLWVRGNGHLGHYSADSVAIVGARSCTSYGADVARELAAGVARQDFCVISGAAFGIDAFAHRGALGSEKTTIAVLAGGADISYPRAHSALLEKIAEHGCIVSEQAPGARPLRQRFLARNRIIAGLALGTAVVEAASRSGSLNTLNWADQLGRAAMAVPGPINSAQSYGTHQAIRDGKAVLVATRDQIIEELGGIGADPAPHEYGARSRYDSWSLPLKAVYNSLDWGRSQSVEQIAATADGPEAKVISHLDYLVNYGFAVHIESGWRLVRRADQA